MGGNALAWCSIECGLLGFVIVLQADIASDQTGSHLKSWMHPLAFANAMQAGIISD